MYRLTKIGVVVESAAVISVIVSLWALWQQSNQVEKTLSQAAYQTMLERQLATHSVFVDDEAGILYPYFSCRPIKPTCETIAETDPNYGRVETIAFSFIDLYQEVLSQETYYASNNNEWEQLQIFMQDQQKVQEWAQDQLEKPLDDSLSTWLNTMKDQYQHSPIMCKLIQENRDMYDDYYADLAQTICDYARLQGAASSME